MSFLAYDGVECWHRNSTKRLKIIKAEQRRQAPSAETMFVEIDRRLVVQASEPGAPAVWAELERPDGLRLRIRPTHGVDLLALVDRFMGVRSCCCS